MLENVVTLRMERPFGSNSSCHSGSNVSSWTSLWQRPMGAKFSKTQKLSMPLYLYHVIIKYWIAAPVLSTLWQGRAGSVPRQLRKLWSQRGWALCICTRFVLKLQSHWNGFFSVNQIVSTIIDETMLTWVLHKLLAFRDSVNSKPDSLFTNIEKLESWLAGRNKESIYFMTSLLAYP